MSHRKSQVANRLGVEREWSVASSESRTNRVRRMTVVVEDPSSEGVGTPEEHQVKVWGIQVADESRMVVAVDLIDRMPK